MVTKVLPLLALGASIIVSAPAATLLQDSFSYTAYSEMSSAGWVNSYGANPSFVSFDSGTNTALSMNNSGQRYDFSSTGIATTDFTLTVNAAQNNFARALYVLVTSAPDVNNVITGYGIKWDSSSSTGWGGQGFMQITKVSYDLDITALGTGTTGTGSTTENGSGNLILASNSTPTTASQFGSFQLTWNNATDTIVLSSSGTTVATLTDSTYSSFSRIYLSGNTTGFFDSISLTTSAIPEPSSYALIAGGASMLAMLRRRRSRAGLGA